MQSCHKSRIAVAQETPGPGLGRIVGRIVLMKINQACRDSSRNVSQIVRVPQSPLDCA